jgi:DNA-binding NarL/FixJ family response regulator
MKSATQLKRSSPSHSLQILLVDDHPAVREGLTMLLGPEDIVVCGEAGDRAGALACVKKQSPDLAIVDLSLDGEDGLGLVADLHQRGLPVLVYSMHHDPHHVQGAIAAGALGYVSKREFNDILVRAVREIAAGRRFLSARAAAALAESVTESSAAGTEKLSPHELQVYELLGQGADTFDIAAALGITNHTVESYYSRILIKLDLNGMHELRRRAIAHFQRQVT